MQGHPDLPNLSVSITFFECLCKRPERQQAVALWWKSKPSFKEHGRQASLLQLKDLDKGVCSSEH